MANHEATFALPVLDQNIEFPRVFENLRANPTGTQSDAVYRDPRLYHRANQQNKGFVSTSLHG